MIKNCLFQVGMERNENIEKRALLLQKGGFHHHTILKERKNLATGNTKRKCHYLGDRKSSAHMEYDKHNARKQWSDWLIDWLNEETCRTCGTHFGKILWLSLPHNNVKFPNLKFWRQREDPRSKSFNFLFLIIRRFYQSIFSVICQQYMKNSRHCANVYFYVTLFLP